MLVGDYVVKPVTAETVLSVCSPRIIPGSALFCRSLTASWVETAGQSLESY